MGRDQSKRGGVQVTGRFIATARQLRSAVAASPRGEADHSERGASQKQTGERVMSQASDCLSKPPGGEAVDPEAPRALASRRQSAARTQEDARHSEGRVSSPEIALSCFRSKEPPPSARAESNLG
ncbi:hypothetical protein AAFF_G00399410 [Aldrovandia affinis]|uniref:Uncharacterized protein n=1 Tax=Aldrovandia affinis TaxID=143900 RepID=A0AAD7SCV1_9TELE|nr:hypothetical protein AAFF_G00399410 [Aldrovandia affinis]